jgi:predicted enzyme related to lactoylglutathione lyase
VDAKAVCKGQDMSQRFEGVTPILRVSDLGASLDYYIKVLAFHRDWGSPWFACVSRGQCHLFLSQGDQGHTGSWVWIGVEDAEALHQEFEAAGARIRHRPTNYEWAFEMQVEDPDGNILRMGSDPKAGEPYGEWLDMNGVRWLASPEGGWVKVET